IADKINKILQNPAGAIQQLNNVLANALGLDVPSIVVTTQTPGSSSADEQQIVTVKDALAGTYTLTYANLVRVLGLAAADGGPGGSLNGTYHYVVTAVTGQGETVGSSEATISVGAAHKVDLTWLGVDGAAAYRIYRGTTTGGENAFFTSMTTSFSDGG